MLPDALAAKILAVWPEEGPPWIARFPDTLQEVCHRWQLSDVVPFPDLSYNFVAFASKRGEPVVLKLGVAVTELWEEARALEAFAGESCASLLAAEDGALLLERLQPGVSLWQTWTPERDEEQTRIVADLMPKLWRPAPAGFPTVRHWCRAFAAYEERFPEGGPIPVPWVSRARELFEELDGPGAHCLLHGDLHHGNIISSGEGWKAIDPKGVVGDPAFEVGTFLRNPCDRILGVPDLERVVCRRLEAFSEQLGIPLQKLAAWSFVVCILSACWSAESDEDASDSIECAKILLVML